MPRPRPLILLAAALAMRLTPAFAQVHNYSEAFQKSLFFYDAQISGTVPLNHRAEFRGDSCTRDGADVGRDLSGGWYDAGDGVVWTGNEGFGAVMLAWSLVRDRDVYIQTGQYDIGMDRLRDITDYLKKIVQTGTNGAIERIYCGKGSIKDSPPDDPAADNDRTEGCPNEVMDTAVGGAPQALRPSYWVDSVTGGADVAGAVSASLAAASIAYRDYGDIVTSTNLLDLAKRTFAWADSNRNLLLTVGGTNVMTATRRMVNGSPVTIANYAVRSSNYMPRLVLSAAWLHRADLAAGTVGYSNAWVNKAEALYNEPVNAQNRGKHWASFATGTEYNGAYAMLAADSGRAAFVSEANAYANFWLYSRSNDSGLSTDPTTSPQGFIARGTGSNWNIHAYADQAAPLLAWADSSFNTNATQKTNLVLLYTGTYSKCPVRQIDYILGSNSNKLSYLQGYKPAGAGYGWVTNLHYRAAWFQYGGFGTPAADKPSWNTATVPGLLAPGPDKYDYYPKDRPLTNGTIIGYQEPIIYSGGLLAVLARNIRAGGSNVGSALSTFPTWETRPSDYQTKSFFVEAYSESTTRLQCLLNNRAKLPPREINTLGFRYYFTPDGVAGSSVTCTATGVSLLTGESVVVSGPTQVGASGVWYFDIKLTNAAIVPGEFSRYRRRVQLDFSQPSGTFSFANDHSGAAVTASQATITNLPIYDTSGGTWKLLGGFEPSAGYVQWRRSHFNNVMESASNVLLIAERVGGTNGAVTATVTCDPGTALSGDFTAPSGPAAVLSWAAGESGEKSFAIPLVQDVYKEGREYFNATLGSFTGGAATGIVATARVSIEDDDFNGSADPGQLVQVLGNGIAIADNDTSPSTTDGTDFGPAEANYATGAVTRVFTIRNLATNSMILTGSPPVQLSGAHAGDFSVVGAPATNIVSGGETTFSIRFAPVTNGTRTATITVPNNKSGDGTFACAVQGTGVLPAPVLGLSSSSLALTLPPGGVSSNLLVTITNSGRAGLTWSASLPTNYVSKTSTDASGPAYEWIDIVSAGPNQGAVASFSPYTSAQDRDDVTSSTIPLGFAFPFYGTNRTALRVCVNGFITFDTNTTSASYNNVALPNSALPSPAIAAWWDDLYLKGNVGDVYYKRVDADTFVVTWNNVAYFSNQAAQMDFQVILKRDGRILCQYQNVLAGSYTIGVQGANASAQTFQHAYNVPTAENNVALEFRAPPQGGYDVAGTAGNWCVISGATNGSVAVLSASNLTLTFHTTNLLSGHDYQTELTLVSNDAAQSRVTIPITLSCGRAYNLAVADAANRAWETPANWSPAVAFPGPHDDLLLTTGGGSLRIDGPRDIHGITVNTTGAVALVGTGLGGTGTGSTLNVTGPVLLEGGGWLAGGSNARMILSESLVVNGGTFGFAAGGNGTIRVVDEAPVSLAGGVLDTLVTTTGVVYRIALGSGDLDLAGGAPQIQVAGDVFTLTRRLTGPGGFTKTGAGVLVLGAAAGSAAGVVELAAGTLRLGAADAIGGEASLRFNGGTLDLNGQTCSMGPVTVGGTGVINCAGGGTLTFADSSTQTWAGTSLILTNFSATNCTVRIGTSSNGLTAGQLAKITLNGMAVALNQNGYLVAVESTPPAWVGGWPKADSATATSFAVRARINEAGTAYFVVLASGASAPTAAQVKAGQNASGGAPLAAGSLVLAADVESSTTVGGRTPATAYDVYFVAEDGLGNLQAGPVLVTVSTVAGSVVWTGGAGDSLWSTGANWDFPPSAHDDVTFPDVTNQVVNLQSSRAVGNVTFNAADPYVFTAAGALVFSNQMRELRQSGAGTVTLSNALTWGTNDIVWGGAGTGRVTLAGALTGTAAIQVTNGNWVVDRDNATTLTAGTRWRLAGGTLTFGNSNRLGYMPASLVSNFVTFDGGALALTNANTLGGRGLFVAAGGGRMDAGGFNPALTLTVSNTLQGSGRLVLHNGGRWDVNYTLGSFNGTFQLGRGAGPGNSRTELRFQGAGVTQTVSAAFEFNDPVSGNAQMIANYGVGHLTLNGPITFTAPVSNAPLTVVQRYVGTRLTVGAGSLISSSIAGTTNAGWIGFRAGGDPNVTNDMLIAATIQDGTGRMNVAFTDGGAHGMTYHVTGTNTYTGGGATVVGAGSSGHQLGTHVQQGTVYAGNSNALGANASSNPINIFRATGNVNCMHAGLLLDFVVDGSLFNRQPIIVRPPNSTVSVLTLGGSQPVQSVFHNQVVITNAFGAAPSIPAAGVALLLHQTAGGRVTFTNSLLSAGWATNTMRAPVFEKTGPGEVLLQSPLSTLSATPVVRNGTLLLDAAAGTNTGTSVLGNATATNLAAFGLGTTVHLGGARATGGLTNVRLATVNDLATNVYNPVGGANGIGQYTNIPNSSLALDNTTLVTGDRVLVLLAGNSQHNSLAPANGVYVVSATNGTTVRLDRTADPVVPGTWVTASTIAGKVHSGRTFYLANQTTNFSNGGANGTVQVWLQDEAANVVPDLNPALLVNAPVTFARDVVVNASPAIQSSTLGGSTTGTVLFTGGVQLARDLTLTSASTGTNSVQFRGIFSGTGSITKTGTGAVTLATANTYSGVTLVSQGALWADAAGGSATGTGAVIVASGGTLGGTGWVSGPVTNLGTVAPGRAGTVGILTVSQSLRLASGSVYDWDAAGGTRDRLNVATASCAGPWTLRVNAPGLTNGTYVLLSTTGGVTGFVAPTILGATGVVSVVGNDIVLAVPGLTPFQQWQMTQFGATNGAAQWDADPDGDGQLNLAEYAMGLNPKAGDAAQGPVLGDNGTHLTLSVPRNADALDVSFHFQASSNLTDWATISTCTATNPGPAGTPVVFTNSVPISASPSQFLRVRFSSP